VTDQGPGFDYEAKASGLGLAIVEKVMELHGGRFVLNPREEGGVEATMWIPSIERRSDL
jgi:signal transduction histidine kinase